MRRLDNNFSTPTRSLEARPVVQERAPGRSKISPPPTALPIRSGHVAKSEGTTAVAEAMKLAGQKPGTDLIGIRTQGPDFLQPGESATGRLNRTMERGRPVTRVDLADGNSFKLSPKDAAGIPTGGRITVVRQGRKLAIDPARTDAVSSFVGTVKRTGRTLSAVSADPSAPFAEVPLSDLKDARPGDAVLVHVTNGLSAKRQGLVQDILPEGQPWKKTFTELAVKAGVDATFEPEIENDLARIRATFDPDNIPGYTDLTDKYFFSIDNPYSRDYDQAMCIEPSKTERGGHDVYYAIADLSYFLDLAGPDSALAQRAQRVQTTTYMPGMDFPVLPRELSEDLCSLGEGDKRPAFVIKYSVSADGKVKRPEFIDGVIVNRKNGNYPEAQGHLDGEKVGDPQYAAGIEALRKVGGSLLEQAKDRGMFMSNGGERWASIDKKTGELKTEDRGQLWIEEANAQISITANQMVGQYLIQNDAPAFHRRHEDPDPQKVDRARKTARAMGVKWPKNKSPEDFAKTIDTSTAKGRAIHRLLLHCMPRAYVSAEPGSHSGLKVAEYVQSTAPMRRTRDGRNHSWVRDVRDGHPPDVSTRDDELERAQSADDRARKLNREVRKRLAADTLGKHTGEKLEAQVVDISPWGVNLFFPALGTEYQAEASSLGAQRLQLVAQGTAAKANGMRFERGQTITAEVLDADPHQGEVRFNISGAVSKAERARIKAEGPAAAKHPFEAVRGDGFTSPLVGKKVSTQGVVSAVNGIGFYIQPEGAAPGSVTGGLLVRTRNTGGIRPGDIVQVEGRVHEQRNREAQYDRSVVEIVKGKASVVGRAEAPTPVVIGGPNAPEIPADPKQATEYWRGLLGQHVQIPPGIAVSPSNRFGDLVVVPEDWSPDGATRTAQGGLVMPDGEWNHQNVGLKWRPHIGDHPSVTVGDRVEGAEGVVTYRSGSFQVELSQQPQVTAGPERPSPVTKLVGEPGKVTVAGVNALNMHPGEAERSEALAQRIVDAMQSPDIIALQEIQDNDGPAKTSVVDASETYEMLIRHIQEAGGPEYAWFDIPPKNGQDGGEPGGNIRCGFLYRPDRVDVDEASVGRIGEGDPAFDSSRKSLVASFEFEGQKLLVVNNHLASRRGSSPWTADLETPIVGRAEQRLGQAETIKAFIEAERAKNPDVDVLIVGDLNDGPSSPTVGALTSGGFKDFTLDIPVEERFDYNYRGTLQVLQPVVGSPELSGRAEIEILHDAVYKGVESSDHDPVIVRVDMQNKDSKAAR